MVKNIRNLFESVAYEREWDLYTQLEVILNFLESADLPATVPNDLELFLKDLVEEEEAQSISLDKDDEDPSETMTIEISNLHPYQVRALEMFMRVLQDLGSEGASRSVTFVADGDGAFRPSVKINGVEAENLTEEEAEKLYPENGDDIVINPDDF